MEKEGRREGCGREMRVQVGGGRGVQVGERGGAGGTERGVQVGEKEREERGVGERGGASRRERWVQVGEKEREERVVGERGGCRWGREREGCASGGREREGGVWERERGV